MNPTEGSDPEPEQEPTPVPEPHPIQSVIDTYLHKIRDIHYCARTFIGVAAKLHKKQFDDLIKKLDDAQEYVQDPDPINQIKGIRIFEQTAPLLDRLASSEPAETMERSLFLGLFSAFDAFIGDFLSLIYTRKPALFSSLSRTLTVKEILSFPSFDHLKQIVLCGEIDDFRRQSYAEQFKQLEGTFGIALRKFTTWPTFVELAQRRNLMTHCDGVVSEQYLSMCREHGHSIPNETKIGTKLDLGPEYLFGSCELMLEVGLKLGHTLWRKIFPEDQHVSDVHLKELMYEALTFERWKRAQMMGEFAYSLPQKPKDLDLKILTINYAISLRFGGHTDKADELLSSIDWSACLPDFRLAAQVLRNEIAEACATMQIIGKEGELISEKSYHVWPLFFEFRSNPQFQAMYEVIYGRSFLSAIEEAAGAAAEKSTTILKDHEAKKEEAER